MPRQIEIRGRPMTLDAILSAAFGAVAGRGLVGETLDMNPGLAGIGPLLPAGTAVLLPDPPASEVPAVSFVSLFG